MPLHRFFYMFSRLSSGAFVVGENKAQKDALIKEFNSLYARYKALGDFK